MSVSITKFFVRSAEFDNGEVELHVKSLEEAVAHVKWSYSGTGKHVIVERVYHIDEVRLHEVDTDFHF